MHGQNLPTSTWLNYGTLIDPGWMHPDRRRRDSALCPLASQLVRQAAGRYPDRVRAQQNLYSSHLYGGGEHYPDPADQCIQTIRWGITVWAGLDSTKSCVVRNDGKGVLYIMSSGTQPAISADILRRRLIRSRECLYVGSTLLP